MQASSVSADEHQRKRRVWTITVDVGCKFLTSGFMRVVDDPIEGEYTISTCCDTHPHDNDKNGFSFENTKQLMVAVQRCVELIRYRLQAHQGLDLSHPAIEEMLLAEGELLPDKIILPTE